MNLNNVTTHKAPQIFYFSKDQVSSEKFYCSDFVYWCHSMHFLIYQDATWYNNPHKTLTTLSSIVTHISILIIYIYYNLN